MSFTTAILQRKSALMADVRLRLQLTILSEAEL
jgi:hypothetical protein